MVIGNRTVTPRAVYVGGEYVAIPPMGVVDIDDRYSEGVLAAIQPLLDACALVINTTINPLERPTDLKGPSVPADLLDEAENPRITPPKPRKTGERMKV